MDERNTWAWVAGGVAVVVIIGGLVWWYSAPRPESDTTNTATTTTTGTNTTTGGTNAGAGSTVTVTDKSSMTVAQVVASLSGASQYIGLFNSTGVGATLVGTNPGSYTVFVSTDAGYGLLAAGTVSNMTAAEKKRMIQYSIVSGKALDVDAVDAGNVQSLSGDSLNFTVGSTGMVQINSSFALQAYRAKNGIVYVVNQPLLPPQKPIN